MYICSFLHGIYKLDEGLDHRASFLNVFRIVILAEVLA